MANLTFKTSLIEFYKKKHHWSCFPWESKPHNIFPFYEKVPLIHVRRFTLPQECISNSEVFDLEHILDIKTRAILQEPRYRGKTAFLKFAGSFLFSCNYLPIYLDISHLLQVDSNLGMALERELKSYLQIDPQLSNLTVKPPLSSDDVTISQPNELPILESFTPNNRERFALYPLRSNVDEQQNIVEIQGTVESTNWQGETMDLLPEALTTKILKNLPVAFLLDNLDALEDAIAEEQINWLVAQTQGNPYCKIFATAQRPIAKLTEFPIVKFSRFDEEINNHTPEVTKIVRQTRQYPLFDELFLEMTSEPASPICGAVSFRTGARERASLSPIDDIGLFYSQILRFIEHDNPYPEECDRNLLLLTVSQIETEQPYLPIAATWREVSKALNQPYAKLRPFKAWWENSGIVEIRENNYYFCDRGLALYLLYLAMLQNNSRGFTHGSHLIDSIWSWNLLFFPENQLKIRVKEQINKLIAQQTNLLEPLLGKLFPQLPTSLEDLHLLKQANWVANLDSLTVGCDLGNNRENLEAILKHDRESNFTLKEHFHLRSLLHNLNDETQ